MDFKGRTVLLTGATRGIGNAVLHQLVAKGAHVVAVSRDAEGLAALRRTHGGTISVYRADLSYIDDVISLAETVRRNHPALSVIIHNAGIQTEMDLVNGWNAASEAHYLQEISVNMTAQIVLTTRLLPLLGQQPDALIGFVTTGLVIAPKAASPVYCATKAGMAAFAKSLRYQCEDAGKNIRITDIVMTLVDTGMTAGRGKGKISPEQAAAALISGLESGKKQVWIGKTKILRALHRLSLELAQRIMR